MKTQEETTKKKKKIQGNLQGGVEEGPKKQTQMVVLIPVHAMVTYLKELCTQSLNLGNPINEGQIAGRMGLSVFIPPPNGLRVGEALYVPGKHELLLQVFEFITERK